MQNTATQQSQDINSSLVVVHSSMDKPVKTFKMVTEGEKSEMRFYESDIIDLTNGKGQYSISNNIGYVQSWNENKAAFYMDFFISKIESVMHPVMKDEEKIDGVIYVQMYGSKFKVNMYTYYKIMKSMDKKFMKQWEGGLKNRKGSSIDLLKMSIANFTIELPTTKVEKVPAGFSQCFYTFRSN